MAAVDAGSVTYPGATVTLGVATPAVASSDLLSALEGTRTPNLLIRSQMLYPLSYERNCEVAV